MIVEVLYVMDAIAHADGDASSYECLLTFYRRYHFSLGSKRSRMKQCIVRVVISVVAAASAPVASVVEIVVCFYFSILAKYPSPPSCHLWSYDYGHA